MAATTTRYAGSKGSFTWNAQLVTAVTDWSFEATGEAVDVTGMSDSFDKKRPVGIAGGKFTATVVFDSASVAAPPQPSQHTATGLSLAFLLIGETVGGHPTISGYGIITSMNLKTAVRGRIEFSVSGETDGDYTITP